MTKEELLKETYYINGERYVNTDIENEIKKHLKHIDVSVNKEYNDIYACGTYDNVHCKLLLDLDYLYSDYKKYIEYIAKEIIYGISKKLFDKGEE